MISERERVFHLQTDHTSWLLRVTRFGHLESIHYGERLIDQPLEALLPKHTIETGGCVLYDPDDPVYCLDDLTLAWSGSGRGDYRHTPAEIRMPDGTFVTDFRYASHRIIDGPLPALELPAGRLPVARGTAADCQSLEISLRDDPCAVTLRLCFTVFPAADVITRRTVLCNDDPRPLVIRRLMSLMLDLPDRSYTRISFASGWIREGHREEQRLVHGLAVLESTTGASANRLNPGFLLAERGASEQAGRVYGFNLIYSGNHYSAVELSPRDWVRVMTGISPHCFEWPLAAGECFETPEAVMTFSNHGVNGASQNFHDFIQRHIVRGDWADRERPVLINSWEANFFRFTERSLLRLARRASRLGIDLFVLDDGWFGDRNSDRAGLGDYHVNRRKLPGGLARLVRRINRLGLSFGLWLEPEMLNPDSDLYRTHPEYAVQAPGRPPLQGRHQLVLDLCRPEVRDHIVGAVRGVLASANIAYIKWDMNRSLSDLHSPALLNQGEFFHRYTLGLYDLLSRIFADRPDILLEGCASGGGRFDLGMLCFAQQVWASDNTDPVERLAIQSGLSCLYPPSTMGCHVSAAPHQQTLRQTPLSTRYNVASFGCLGYELDLKYLNRLERQAVRQQVAEYKAHRRTLQFGRFYRLDAIKDNKVHFQAVARDGSESVAGFFQTGVRAAEGADILPLAGLDPEARYEVATRPQRLPLRRFGILINHLLPFPLDPDSWLIRLAGRFYSLADCVERYTAGGDLLLAGLRLNTAFAGTGVNPEVRLLGDYDANLYDIRRLDSTESPPA